MNGSKSTSPQVPAVIPDRRANDRVHGQLVASLVQAKLPMDALRRDLAVIPRVDMETINAAAKSGLYNWDDLLIVLVGDKSVVLPQLKEARFPEPQIVDEEGRPAS